MSEIPSPIDEMYLEGLEMKRAQIRRGDPTLDEETVEKLLRKWIMDRPMDAPGRIRFAWVSFLRRRKYCLRFVMKMSKVASSVIEIKVVTRAETLEVARGVLLPIAREISALRRAKLLSESNTW